jgi:hypothetical protein
VGAVPSALGVAPHLPGGPFESGARLHVINASAMFVDKMVCFCGVQVSCRLTSSDSATLLRNWSAFQGICTLVSLMVSEVEEVGPKRF